MANSPLKNAAIPFRQAFCLRTKQLRERKGWTQEQMATALRIPLDRYSKYERRSPLPHDLVPTFCQIVECSIDDLFRPAVVVTLLPKRRRDGK